MSGAKWNRVKMAIFLAISGAVCLGGMGFLAYQYVDGVITDAYAQWWVASMIVEHMERNNDSWPHSWDELEESYEICAGRSGKVWAFDDIRSRVHVDFAADPLKLAKAPGFQVISLRNGKRTHWERREPNEIIWRYLDQRPVGPPCKRPADPTEKQARVALLDLGARWVLNDDGKVVKVDMASFAESPRYSDSDMIHLRSFKDLQELGLSNSNITDAGLENVEELTNLQELYLSGTKVTDAGLMHLRAMKQLEILVLGRNFSDSATDHISQLQNLKNLNLNGSRVTDTGLLSLGHMANLQEIQLYNTQVTDEGVRQFQEALPNCRVSR